MQKSVEIAQALRAYLEAIAAGDVAAVEAMMSEEVLLIGTDPDEWWQGGDEARRVFRTQLAEMGGAMPIVVNDPQGYVDGDVGWAADRPLIRLPDGDHPFRVTITFRREDDGWKVVQSHASIGVPNQETLGRELST
jgi:ketosteroid isomerase-like protein